MISIWKRGENAFWAMRMVVGELLHGSIDDMIEFVHLTPFLQTLTEQNPTSKLSEYHLIIPVFFVILSVLEEREGDSPLHLNIVSKMVPWFLAASHQNYARYALYYLHDVKKLAIQY